MPRIRLLVPANIRHNSGGNVYNAKLARALEEAGAGMQVVGVDGGWPVGSEEDRRRLAAALAAVPPDDGTVTIVDGLIASGAPEALEAAAAAGRPAWMLMHMLLEDRPDLERRAVHAAAGVVCTSSWTARGVREQHGLPNTFVALPGTVAAPLAHGSEPPRLIAVAALLPNKDQLLLARALALVLDLPWTAAFVGSDAADPGYAAQVREAVNSLGLQERVRLPGELTGAPLQEEWLAADLSLLVSRVEAFGMAVPESLARGIPVVVRAGTGAVEALGLGTEELSSVAKLPGTAVRLEEDPAPLAAVLRAWLTDGELRRRWREAALAARNNLPGWDKTAHTVLRALTA